MNTTFSKISCGWKQALMMILSLALGLLCTTAFGHEWTVEGRKVKAKAVDFNGSHVLLENKVGKQKAFAINQLNERDLQYLTNLLSIRNAEIQRQLETKQLEQQRAQLLSQFVDLWAVSMVAPNGERAWRNYFANNSLEAKQQAFREFPNVRVVGVQRVRRGNAPMGNANSPRMPLNNRLPIWVN